MSKGRWVRINRRTWQHMTGPLGPLLARIVAWAESQAPRERWTGYR